MNPFSSITLSPHDLTRRIDEHFEQCVNMANQLFELDLLETALKDYCDGCLNKTETALFADIYIDSFIPWACTRWPLHNKRSISELICQNITSTASKNLSFRLQATPFCFYKIESVSSLREHIALTRLIDNELLYIKASHLGIDFSSIELIRDTLLFAMIDNTHTRRPVCYGLAPIVLSGEELPQLLKLHQRLRQNVEHPLDVLQFPLYDTIAHSTYINSIVKRLNNTAYEPLSNFKAMH